MHRFVTAIFLTLGVLFFSQARAAEVKLMKELSTPEFSVIFLYGDIAQGDANELLTVVADTKNAVVVLQSDGGDANEGLALAKLIKKLGYDTAVVGQSRCMSACALIWISGAKRLLSKDAIVGFHSVYSSSGVSGGGNAIYGAFYGQLGLSDRAIIYLTSAPPDGYNQVTLAIAPLLDIVVLDWDAIIKQPATPPKPPNNSVDPSAESSTAPTTVPPPQPTNGSGTTGYPAFAKENGVDIIGFDLQKGSFRTDNPDSCAAACNSNSICMAYTYDTKNQICYQKTGGKLLLSNSDAISGARASLSQTLKRSSIVIFGKKDSPGFDLRSVVAESLQDCVFECDNDLTCKAFTWTKKQKACVLKSGDRGLVANKFAVSGIKQQAQ